MDGPRRTAVVVLLPSVVLLCALAFIISGRGAELFGALFRSSPSYSSFRTQLAAADSLSHDGEGASAALDAAERAALGLESHLSVAKRRRALARRSSAGAADYREQYLDFLERLQAAFPHAAEPAILALEARFDGPGGSFVPPETIAAAAQADPDAAYAALVLSGALRNARSALGIADLEHLPAAPTAGPPLPDAAAYRTNEVLLLALRGDRLGARAAAAEGPLRRAAGMPPLGALLAYDYGDRAAAASSAAADADGAPLAADAYYLAGAEEEARSRWAALAEAPEHRARVLYNLASTARSEADRAAALSELSAESGALSPYAAMLLSRSLSDAEAAALLERSLAAGPHPLLELERLRRAAPRLGRDWAAGELWMILGRHPASLEAYEWGAYFFELNGLQAELGLLRAAAERNGVASPRLAVHGALDALRRGDSAGAEALLRTLDAAGAPWQVSANLAVVREHWRDYAGAVAYYQAADSLAEKAADRAVLHVRIARCFKAMDRPYDARRSLEYALDLDPSNLEASLELRKK